jgi:hypothetical protein
MKIKKKKKETVGADGLERARSDSSLRRITASFAHLEEYGNVKQAREIFEAFARIAEILADF